MRRQLTKETIDLMLRLIEEGEKSRKDIAIACQVSHETVRKYIIGKRPIETRTPLIILTESERFLRAKKNQDIIIFKFMRLKKGDIIKVFTGQYARRGIIVEGEIIYKDKIKIIINSINNIKRVFVINDFICSNAILV